MTVTVITTRIGTIMDIAISIHGSSRNYDQKSPNSKRSRDGFEGLQPRPEA